MEKGASGCFRSCFALSPGVEQCGNRIRQICFTQAVQKRGDLYIRPDALNIDAHRDRPGYRDHGPIASMREIEFEIRAWLKRWFAVLSIGEGNGVGPAARIAGENSAEG